MLGTQVRRSLESFHPIAPSRTQLDLSTVSSSYFNEFDIVVNCAGVVPQLQPSEKQLAELNTNLVRKLARSSARVVHFSSDCVFSGKSGKYRESSGLDAKDPYGLSKAKADLYANDLTVIRASIVGPDERGYSLLSWIQGLEDHSEVQGYCDHLWNGVTSITMSNVVRGIIESGDFHSGVRHLVPLDQVSKAELIRLLAARLGKTLTVTDVERGPIDKTLVTDFPSYNDYLWELAGWSVPPSIAEMINRDLNETFSRPPKARVNPRKR